MSRTPSGPETMLLGIVSGFAFFECVWAFALMDRAGLLIAMLLGAKGWQAWKEAFHGKV